MQNSITPLTIYSTDGFQVQVKSSTVILNNSIQTATTNSIQTNSISILHSAGTDGLSEVVYTQRFLSSKDQTIVSPRAGGAGKKYLYLIKALVPMRM